MDDKLNKGFGPSPMIDDMDRAGLPGKDAAGFFERLNDRIGYPPKNPDWVEQAIKARREESSSSRPVYDVIDEKQRIEAGPDEENATRDYYDNVESGMALLADICNNTAKVVEIILSKGLDRAEENDPVMMDAKLEKIVGQLREVRAELKKFRKW